MACSLIHETEPTTAADELTTSEARECLIEKLLCTLISAGSSRPKFRSTLQNALSHCTAVVPYMNPLNVLAAANEASAEPTVSVGISYPKKRVYTELETVRVPHRVRRLLNLISTRPETLVAPLDSAIEESMMDDVIAWLKSDPEGTEVSLVTELIQRCEKEFDFTGIALGYLEESGIAKMDKSVFSSALHFFPYSDSSIDLLNKVQQSEEITLAENVAVRALRKLYDIPPARFPLTAVDFCELVQPACKVLFTVPPARLFGMNRRRIKHREVEDDKTETPTAEAVKPQSDSDQEAASNRKPKLEFAIGVQPGENDVRQRISLTPEGLVGIEAPITDRGNAAAAEATDDSESEDEDNDRMRAVGQTKGLAEFFTNRLTVAVRSHNAVLVPANEEEQQHINSRVREWLNSKRKGPTTEPDRDHDDDEQEEEEVASSNPLLQTVPKLQQELANMCVGKMRRLAPSTITDLLQSAGYISIGDDDKVSYHLPTKRGNKTPSWQQKTVESAVKSCNLSSLMRGAYPRHKRRRNTDNLSDCVLS